MNKKYGMSDEAQCYGARLQVYKGGLVPCERNADVEEKCTTWGETEKDAMFNALFEIADNLGYKLIRK